MKDFTFQSTSIKLFYGESKLPVIAAEIKGYGSKILVVFGGSSFKTNGYYQPFVDSLTKEGITLIDFGDNNYPSLAKVREGIDICREENGGGTCMDVAKAITFGTMQEEDIWKFLTYELSEEGRPHLPIGTIVTYPSSGSEMNGAAQINEDDTKKKAGLSFVYPNFTWLNPEYMMSIGSTQLAYGQLTAFVQGSSGYISLDSGAYGNHEASLLKAILDNLKRSIDNPADKETRGNLMLTSAMNMFGFTFFGKTGDQTLMPLTGLMQTYLDIPYTKALTIIFPYFLKEVYNGDRVFKSYFQNALGLILTVKRMKIF